MPSIQSKLSWLLLCGLFLSPFSAFSQDAAKIDFVKTIKPIFEQHCLKCHGEEDPEAFRIDERDEAMDYIDVDFVEDSTLYQTLVSDDEDELMPPPDEENPLTAGQIASVKTWISQGADWPDDLEWVTTSEPETLSGIDETAVQDIGKNAKKLPAVDPKTQRIYNALGSLHPAAVHLPIGLLLAAGLFALFSLRGNFVMSDCAYYCLWLGAVGAVVACISGWYFSPMEGKGTVLVLNDLWEQKHPVFWHRLSGIICTIFAFLLALFAASARNRDPDDGMMWKLGLILLALGISYVGHEGGELTHGKHHYDDLKAIGAELLPGVFGESGAEPKKLDETAKPAQDESGGTQLDEPDTVEEVGKSSDET